MTWSWPWSAPKVDPVVLALNAMIESQRETSAMVIQAVQSISGAAEKQAEVLKSYLALFTTPGEPQRFTAEQVEEEENLAELAKQGFPSEGTEVEQAEWVLARI